MMQAECIMLIKRYKCILRPLGINKIQYMEEIIRIFLRKTNIQCNLKKLCYNI